MFRDPTKFYLLIVLSYAILIPYTIGNFVRYMKGKKFSEVIPLVVCVLFIFLWVFTIRESVFGLLKGTFTAREVPDDYKTIRTYILDQQEFFRTLWIPSEQRFTPYSHNHPSISASYLFNATSSAELVMTLASEESKRLLQELSVKYVIIPYDSLGELFLTDRKYDDKKRQDLEQSIDSIPWFTKVAQGKITVYQTPAFHDHFWTVPKADVFYQMIDPSHYRVSVALPEPATLYFSETYHSGWKARFNNTIFSSQKANSGINSFALPVGGTYSGDIYFEPERIAHLGFVISGISFVFIVLFVALLL